MNIAIMSTGVQSARTFAANHSEQLRKSGIILQAVIVDTNAAKKRNPLKYAYRVAARQARVGKCSTAAIFARRLCWKVFFDRRQRATASAPDDLPDGLVCRVSSLNSPEALDVLKNREVQVTCLMGAGILKKETLDQMPGLVLNIHASDPRFVRGGPPVFWEILAGHSDIVLTVHQVVPRLDAGPIYGQVKHAINFCGGIAETQAETMRASRPATAGLFSTILSRLSDVHPEEFTPGPVRTIPRIREMFAADSICRKKSALTAVCLTS